LKFKIVDLKGIYEYLLFSRLIVMITLFHPIFGKAEQSRDSNSIYINEFKARIQTAHLEISAQLKSVIIEQLDAYQKAVKDVYLKNIVIIDGQNNYEKVYGDVKSGSGAEIFI
jgi:hypothetical protein